MKEKNRKAGAELQAPAFNFYCSIWAFKLPGQWGSKPKILKVQWHKATMCALPGQGAEI